MLKNKRTFPEVDGKMVVWGTLLGLIVGGLVTLFTAPKSGKDNRKQITEATQSVRTSIPTPSDPVQDSLAEGKAAARRRRDELGV